MSNWGVPDWKSINEYPQHEFESGWRWEFLRRLPEYRDAWQQRTPECLYTSYTEHREKWGISILQDPANPTVTSLGFWLRGAELQEYLVPQSRIESNGDFGEFDWGSYKTTDVLLRFDLTKDVTKQLKKASSTLKKLQLALSKAPGNRRHTPLELTRYLRVIDAKDAKVSNREIGELLCRPKMGEVAAEEAKRLARKAKGVQLRYAFNDAP